MNLCFNNNLFNNFRENNFVKGFTKELAENLKGTKRNNKICSKESWNNLLEDDLTLYGKKIITIFRDKMLIERFNILQNYFESTKENGEMYYVYNKNSNGNNFYNLCICNNKKSHDIITQEISELPKGTFLGCVLRKKDNEFILDYDATESVEKEINIMIKENIKEQYKYLGSKRVEGHIYEVGEKYSGRIWLYDLNNITGGGMEGIEEIEFPEKLYETAEEGDLFIYQNGEYQRYVK